MATLARWDPFREIAALQNEMGRLLGTFLREPSGVTDRTWVPALDVWETDDEIVYAFDLPGIPEDKITLEVENGMLTVSAERQREHEVKEDRFYRYERRFGTFARSVALPQGVTESDITAQYRNGVLEVHVRKPEEAKPHRIQIKVGEKATIEGKAKKD
ncbi:MAG: heat-shock protein [Thermoleophilia bacterium]